jgi:hypothetical protein
VPSLPPDDATALILRDHFQTEASDAGLRSMDLSGSGVRGSAAPDTAAVARASMNRQEDHRRAREALRRIGKPHADVLALAYGTELRDRDMDDGRRGKAPKRTDRDWRVVLRETFALGPLTAIVTISLTARTHADLTHDGNVLRWLLSAFAGPHREKIQAESLEALEEARKAFAAAYEPPPGRPRLDAQPKARRGRPFDKERIRFRALDGAHNLEIKP